MTRPAGSGPSGPVFEMEFSPCPFCLATEHVSTDGAEVSARIPVASPALPDQDLGIARRAVVALLHREGCPRRSPKPLHPELTSIDTPVGRLSEASFSASSTDDVYRVPGEKGPPLPLGAVNAEELAPLTNAISSAIRSAIDEEEVPPDPVTLASVLVGIACATAAAADENYVPPIFLIGFLPQMGIDESVAIGMVRIAYEEGRKFAEAVVENERLDLAMEQAVAEAEAQRKSEN